MWKHRVSRTYYHGTSPQRWPETQAARHSHLQNVTSACLRRLQARKISNIFCRSSLFLTGLFGKKSAQKKAVWLSAKSLTLFTK
jgi:hypothetical protein